MIFALGVGLTSLIVFAGFASKSIPIIIISILIGATIIIVAIEYSGHRSAITWSNRNKYHDLVHKNLDPNKGDYDNPGFFHWIKQKLDTQMFYVRRNARADSVIRKNYKDE